MAAVEEVNATNIIPRTKNANMEIAITFDRRMEAAVLGSTGVKHKNDESDFLLFICGISRLRGRSVLGRSFRLCLCFQHAARGMAFQETLPFILYDVSYYDMVARLPVFLLADGAVFYVRHLSLLAS